VESVLTHFPSLEPVTIPDVEEDTVAEYFFEAYPKAEGNRAYTITASKSLMVIGPRADGALVEPFPDRKALLCHGFYHVHALHHGCFFNCQYCFLQDTSAGVTSYAARDATGKEPPIKYITLNPDYEAILQEMKHIAVANLEQDRATAFQTGIMSDSFAMEPEVGFIRFLIPRMDDPAFARTRFETISKACTMDVLWELAGEYPWATERFEPAFSVNAVRARDRFELRTATIPERLAAADKVAEAGYPLRLRIDPVIPTEGWEQDYTDLVDQIYMEYGLRPASLILGSIRYDEETLLDRARERFPHAEFLDLPLFKEPRDKYRTPFEDRCRMYRAIVDRALHHHPDQVIGLCKEPVKMWQRFEDAMDPHDTCGRCDMYMNAGDNQFRP